METTLNIRHDLLQQIARVAQSEGVSRSEIIMFLIKKTTADMSSPEGFGSLVRYQSRQKSGNWRVFHVQVREDMYEYWLDLRKLLKSSVSLILARAVVKYLGKPLEKNGTDNYRCTNYVLMKTVFRDVIVWKLIWGYPPDLEKLLRT